MALASVPPSRSPVSYLVVHLLGAVEDVDHHAHRPAQVLGGLRLPSARRAGRGPPHEEVEGLRQGDVAPAEVRTSGLSGAGGVAQPQSRARRRRQREVQGAVPLPICQGGDDQPGGVPQVLVGVLELSVADVGVAVPPPLVPAVPELGLPGERLGTLHLRSSWLRRAGRHRRCPPQPTGTASSHTHVRTVCHLRT